MASSEERLSDWNTEEARKFIVHDVFLVLYFFAGVIGNAVVLVVYQTKLKKRSDSRYFFPFLAFFDLFACGIRAPFELWKTLLPVNLQDIVACQTVWWILNVFTFSSIFLLAVITFQRYRKVCCPFGFQLNLNVRRGCLVVVVLLSMGLASPFIIWNEKLEIPNPERNVTGYICGANVLKVDANSNSFLAFILIVSLLLLLVMIVLVVLNLLILRTIFKTLKNKNTENKYKSKKFPNVSLEFNKEESTTNFQSKECTSNTEISKDSESCDQMPPKEHPDKPKVKSSSSSVMRFSYMVMVISLAYILSCIPQISLLFSLSRNRFFWVDTTETEAAIFKFMDQMMIINNIVNPYVYGYFDLKFRFAAMEVLNACCRRRPTKP